MKDKYLIFLDVETSGLPKDKKLRYYEEVDNWPRIVQIAWIKTNLAGEIISQYSFIAKPVDFEIPIASTNVHGITQEYALEHGIVIKKIMKVFNKDLSFVSNIVAHNASFDYNTIGGELTRLNLDKKFRKIRYICTMWTSLKLCNLRFKNGGLKFPKLVETYSCLFGEVPEERHEALYDCELCMKCYFELVKLGVPIKQ